VSRGGSRSHFPRLCRALLAEDFHFKDNLSPAEHFGNGLAVKHAECVCLWSMCE